MGKYYETLTVRRNNNTLIKYLIIRGQLNCIKTKFDASKIVWHSVLYVQIVC